MFQASIWVSILVADYRFKLIFPDMVYSETSTGIFRRGS
jgi:hypothetical protein